MLVRAMKEGLTWRFEYAYGMAFERLVVLHTCMRGRESLLLVGGMDVKGMLTRIDKRAAGVDNHAFSLISRAKGWNPLLYPSNYANISVKVMTFFIQTRHLPR